MFGEWWKNNGKYDKVYNYFFGIGIIFEKLDK